MKNKIINLLSKGDLTKKELMSLLNIMKDGNQVIIFNRIISRLIKSKSVVNKNGKYHLENNPLTSIGIFSLSKDGFGFIDTKKESFYVHGSNVLKSLTGDKVKYQVIRKSKDSRKSEAKVLEIIERKSNYIIGEIIESKDNELYKFKPYSYIDYIFEIENEINVTIGDVVVGKIKEIKNKNIELKLTNIIGQTGDNDIDIKKVLFEKGIPNKFPQNVINQADAIEIYWEKEKSNRTDLTNEIIITIDGEDAKDLDDAIMVKKVGKNYLLSVSIADVSYFVTKDSSLDKEAYKRGTSIYLVDTVVPMLPKIISNNLSSLNENGIKLTITCDMIISNEGKTLSTKIYPSFIKSVGRLTYKEVNELFKTGKSIQGRDKKISSMLLDSKKLAEVIRKKRREENMVDFDLGEVKLKVDNDGKVIDIKKRVQDEAEQLIENFMISANEAVATWFTNNKIPSLYRVHEPPLQTDILIFKQILKSFDLNKDIYKPGPILNAKGYQKIIDASNEKEYGFIIKKLAIQSMTKAIYDFRNKGHFGLGLKNYTHFTSPIRRYPDLIVHRLLRHHLFNRQKTPLQRDLSDLSIRTSYTEKRAQEAERKVTDIKVSKYMTNFLNKEFEGYIISIQKWGFFVQLPNTIEGLVPSKTLVDDIKFDQENRQFISKDKKILFKIGDKVKVQLKEVNVIKGLCNFRLVI